MRSRSLASSAWSLNRAGAKNIGGEVKLSTIESGEAQRGYLVAPDPDDKAVEAAYKDKALKEFERHSRLGMVDYDAFMKNVEHFRKIGAKFVSLKTGAYRVSDLARAIRYASDAKLDLLTIDGAGGAGGTLAHDEQWGIPTIYLQRLHTTSASSYARKRSSCRTSRWRAASRSKTTYSSPSPWARLTKAVCIPRDDVTDMVGRTSSSG
jgi:hypothetical protein